MNLWKYSALSFLAAGAVLAYTYITREQYYLSVMLIVHSSTCLLIMYNLLFVMILIFGVLIRKMFLGPLRASEVEHLYEQSWLSVTETCLAMTIFRDEFNGRFVSFFAALLFFKIFHWLAADRVDYMEQSPILGRIFHIRMIALMTILSVVDVCFITYASFELLEKGPSMQILFGFEFLVLVTTMISTIFKYILAVIDSRHVDPWENKSMYVFYLELIIDFLRLAMYMCFFCVVMTFYGLPLHIMRDLYLTFRSFLKRFWDMIQYHRATANMNERYPDATPEELALVDNTCIICREDMTSAKRLPCGHVFHLHCLRSWLERQQTCPTCRRSVLVPNRNLPQRATVPPVPPQGPQANFPMPPQPFAGNMNFPPFPPGQAPPPTALQQQHAVAHARARAQVQEFVAQALAQAQNQTQDPAQTTTPPTFTPPMHPSTSPTSEPHEPPSHQPTTTATSSSTSPNPALLHGFPGFPLPNGFPATMPNLTNLTPSLSGSNSESPTAPVGMSNITEIERELKEQLLILLKLNEQTRMVLNNFGTLTETIKDLKKNIQPSDNQQPSSSIPNATSTTSTTATTSDSPINGSVIEPSNIQSENS